MTQARYVVLGAGGHARVLLSMLRTLSREVVGLVDTNPALKNKKVDETRVLGADDVLDDLDRAILLVNGIGSVGSMERRRRAFEIAKARGFTFATVVHPRSIVDPVAVLEEGSQVFAGAIVQAGCVIGANAILNSGAIVDHDCRIGQHCHIAPGAVLSGNVSVGDATHIGVGATVIQGITIGADCVIGAGSVVIADVLVGSKVAGSPAKAL